MTSKGSISFSFLQNFLFFSSKFKLFSNKIPSHFFKLENSATGPSTAAMRLEIWHMFNMLVLLYYRQVNKYNQIKAGSFRIYALNDVDLP